MQICLVSVCILNIITHQNVTIPRLKSIKVKQKYKMDDFFKDCQQGNIQQVLSQIHQGQTNWNGGLRYACLGGHLEIVKLMISKGAKDLNQGFVNACSSGHIDIVQYLFYMGARDLN